MTETIVETEVYTDPEYTKSLYVYRTKRNLSRNQTWIYRATDWILYRRSYRRIYGTCIYRRTYRAVLQKKQQIWDFNNNVVNETVSRPTQLSTSKSKDTKRYEGNQWYLGVVYWVCVIVEPSTIWFSYYSVQKYLVRLNAEESREDIYSS